MLKKSHLINFILDKPDKSEGNYQYITGSSLLQEEFCTVDCKKISISSMALEITLDLHTIWGDMC